MQEIQTWYILRTQTTTHLFTLQESMQLMLPVAHKYAFLEIVKRACTLVTASLSLLDGRAEGPNSILAWLQLAEGLQLDALKASLMGAIQSCSVTCGHPFLWILASSVCRWQRWSSWLAQHPSAGVGLSSAPVAATLHRMERDAEDATQVWKVCSNWSPQGHSQFMCLLTKGCPECWWDHEAPKA